MKAKKPSNSRPYLATAHRDFRSVFVPVLGGGEHIRKVVLGIFEFRKERPVRNWIFERHAMRPLSGAIDFINDPEIEDGWLRRQIPVVNISNQLTRKRTAAVVPDDYRVGELAAEFFTSRNYRNFAFFGPSYSYNAHLRLEGFRSGLTRKGFQCTAFGDSSFPPAADNPEALQPGRHDAARDDRLREWLATLPHGTALFAHDDYLAQQIIDTCVTQGIAVPEHLAVLGVNDDAIICELALVPISSIAINSHLIGLRAAELLQHMLSGGTSFPQAIVVPPAGVIERSSTLAYLTDDPLLNTILQWLEAHLHEGISAESLATTWKISQRTLERKFRAALHCSPYQHILNRKLDRANKLLATHNHDLPTLAERCGFADPNSFTLAFKRKFGITPQQIKLHRHTRENHPG